MRYSVCSVALLAVFAFSTAELKAGKSRGKKSLVSFHLEADDKDRPKKTTRIIIGTETFRVRLAPAFSHTDIVGYYPFLAEDGLTMGAAFKLNPRAAKRLRALSESARGSKLFTIVGKDSIHYVVLNAPIEDGYIVCWKGLKLDHMDAFKKAGIEQIKPAQNAAPAPAEPADARG